MSLLEWSTPERRVDDRDLPIIANEIYLHILTHVAPATRRPLREELDTLKNLSLVCRLFANICLPRVFEHVEISGAPSQNDVTHKASQGTTLCQRIAAQQPLALSLARYVQACHFTDWQPDRAGFQKCIQGLTLMKNIRRLNFLKISVGTNHWRAITTLKSLEELCFDTCKFLRLHPDQNIKVKVYHLRLINGGPYQYPVSAIDARFLHALTTDGVIGSRSIDWSPQSPFRELHIRLTPATEKRLIGPFFVFMLQQILEQVPKCVEVVSFPVPVPPDEELPRLLFALPWWRNLPHLRSLAMEFKFQDLTDTSRHPEVTQVVSYVLEGTRSVETLQTLMVTDNTKRHISSSELRDILRQKINATSSLRRLDIYGRVFGFVDEEWKEVHCNTT